MLFFNIKKTLSLKNIRSLFVRPNTIQHKDVQKTETAPLTKKRIIPSSNHRANITGTINEATDTNTQGIMQSFKN